MASRKLGTLVLQNFIATQADTQGKLKKMRKARPDRVGGWGVGKVGFQSRNLKFQEEKKGNQVSAWVLKFLTGFMWPCVDFFFKVTPTLASTYAR